MKRHKKHRVPTTSKKIARVEKNDLDKAFHAQLIEARHVRDDRLATAGATYRKTIREAQEAFQLVRGDVYREFDERRDEILRSLAPEAQAA